MDPALLKVNCQILLPEGCGRLGSLRCLNGVSVSGSVYFFRRCASKSSFSILRTSFFSPSNNFLVNLNGFFFKLHLAFCFFCQRFLAFSALAMTRIFSLTSDNCFFTNSHSFGISLSRFLRSLCSTLSWPFLTVFYWLFICFFSFLDVFSSKMLKANCINSFSERMYFHSDRSSQPVLENKGHLFIEDLPSIIIRFRPINVNCIPFHTEYIRVTK